MAQLAVLGNVSRDVIISSRRRQVVLGGAALHISVAAASAHVVAAPVAVVGKDLAEVVLGELSRAAVDTSALRIDHGSSATFTLVYDKDDNLVDVTGDPGVASGMTEHVLRRIERGGDHGYHVCARSPLDVRAVVSSLIERRARFSVDLMVSSLDRYVDELGSALTLAEAVFVNSVERELLAAKGLTSRVPVLVVSDGARPASVYRRGVLSCVVTPPRVAVVGVTGAGDTLIGGFLARKALGASDEMALSGAVAAASAHVSADPRVVD